MNDDKNISNATNITLIGDYDDKNILTRTILCIASYICCLILIVIYFVLCLQVKFNVCTKKKDIDKDSNDLLEDDSEENKEKNKKEKGKIGLGSNFMFFLTISNFFGSFFESLFYFYYKDKVNLIDQKTNYERAHLFQEINDSSMCQWLGFAHNFFDLFTVCWTSMLTLLFYKSTNLSSEMLYKDTKYLIIGFIFSITVCSIFCVIPMITNSYGFARFYCSFKYNTVTNFDDTYQTFKVEKEEPHVQFWRYCFAAVALINNLFNVFCLVKTSRFYSKKLDIIKKQNKKEYDVMRRFVWVFRIFPIVLMSSRLYKAISRVITNSDVSETVIYILEYINSFFFASNGIIDSLACILFFRGVLWCCSSDTRSNTIDEDDEKKESKMNDIGIED